METHPCNVLPVLLLCNFYCTIATEFDKDPLKENWLILNLTNLFIALLGELGQVEVQDRETPGGDITARKPVHHEHGPDRTLPLPVTCTEESKPSVGSYMESTR